MAESMDLGRLLAFFETSPAVRLLRAQHAPYIVDFLHRQFKRTDSIAIPHDDLLAALTAFQEELHSSSSDVLRDTPEVYLADWCSDERRWLHRFLEAGRAEPVYQLTSDTESVLEFLGRALEQGPGFVGTGSRLGLVIDTLESLVVGSSDEPAVHLEHLQREKTRIEQQIARIQSEESVESYEPARVREHFATAVTLLNQLQADFRAVEESFKEITHEVQQRQIHGRESRGGILGDALDAEDTLMRQDQGVSFGEFLRLIHSPSQQDRLRGIVRQLGQIPELAEQAEGLKSVRRMVPLLLTEAEKVTQTTRRLSTTLRRLLDVRVHRERQRVAELLGDIRGFAVALADCPPGDGVGLHVDNSIEILSPFARTFWSEPARFEPVDLTEHVVDDAQRLELFGQLAGMHRIDWGTMRSQIQSLLAGDGHVTLRRLLDEYPPGSGVVEVLGYLQIASEDGHLIDRDGQEEIVLTEDNGAQRPLAVTVPLVTFLSRDS